LPLQAWASGAFNSYIFKDETLQTTRFTQKWRGRCMPESAISFATKLKQQQSLFPKAKQTKEHAQTGAIALTKLRVLTLTKKGRERD
jgi:hypothetical protein